MLPKAVDCTKQRYMFPSYTREALRVVLCWRSACATAEHIVLAPVLSRNVPEDEPCA